MWVARGRGSERDRRSGGPVIRRVVRPEPNFRWSGFFPLCKGKIVQPRGLLESQPHEFFPLLHPRMFCQNFKCNWPTVAGVSDKPAQIFPVNEPIAGNDMVNILPDPV